MFSSKALKFALLAGLALLSATSRYLFGYAFTGTHWPPGNTIVIQLQLGSTTVGLQDGLRTWNASAADALALWNQQLGPVQFSWITNSNVSKTSGDRFNSAFFSNTVFGDSFGSDVLAVTIWHSHYVAPTVLTTEADVIFNTAVRYNSYRGPLQHSSQGNVYDFHRVALHEFGHVLGLDHPDDGGQTVVAIMNSRISNLDHLAPDDIAGVHAIYDSSRLNLLTGSQFSYQITASNHPTRYAAANLPPGLYINTATGLIRGIPTISGSYTATITAYAPSGNLIIGLQFVVTPVSLKPGQFLAKFELPATKLALDPTRPRAYASLTDDGSVAVIDTGSLSLLKTIPVGEAPIGLSTSADGSKLWVANYTSQGPAITPINLNNLQSLTPIRLPQAAYSVVEGLDGRLYASAANGQVMQIASRLAIPSVTLIDGLYPPVLLAITPDRKSLFAGDTQNPPSNLLKFDVSTANANVAQRCFPSSLGGGSDLKVSHDGKFLCFTNNAGNGYGTTREIPTPDITASNGIFHNAEGANTVAFSPDDLVAYIGVSSLRAVQLFDTKTFRSLGSIDLHSPDELGEAPAPIDLAVDTSGTKIFAVTTGSDGLNDLRVFSTGRNEAPSPPPAGPKSLANVSTRMRTNGGDNVLIGGFIITGTAPKRIILRAIGPSLPVSNKLADPVLELYNGSNQIIAQNDNWNSHRDAVLGTRIPPKNEHEAAIVATLQPGNYTAILRGIGNSAGVALVELYDLSGVTASKLANISTRGKVETGDNVMIGGFIIGGTQPTEVVIRAIGPSLSQAGVQGALQDPVLELHGSNGALIFQNDNWRTSQQADIIATRIPPTDNRESAIVATLRPGSYTAIVRGKNNTTGVALVEVYNLETN